METILVKISGALSDDPAALDLIADYILKLRQNGVAVILVHGGGKQINTLSAKLGVEITQIEGRRVTTPEALEVLLYTVGGTLNRGLVSDLRQKGILSVGLTGGDADLTTAHRRKPLRINNMDVDFQLVGEIDEVNPSLLQMLLQAGYTPVVGCLTWSAEEGLLNINADTLSIKIASALGCSELVMLMEPESVLDAEKKRIPEMTPSYRDRGVLEGWIKDGMIPKLHTGFQALGNGIKRVRLTNPSGLFVDSGTILIPEKEVS